MFNKPETFKSAFRLWKYSYVVLLIAFLIFYILFRPSDKTWTEHVFFFLKIVGLITVSTLLIFLLSFIFMKVSRFSAKLLFVIFPLPLLVLTAYSVYFFFLSSSNSKITTGLKCTLISDCNKLNGVIVLTILIPLNLLSLMYFLKTYWQRSNHQSYYRRIWYYFVVILLLLILAAVGYAVYYYNLQQSK